MKCTKHTKVWERSEFPNRFENMSKTHFLSSNPHFELKALASTPSVMGARAGPHIKGEKICLQHQRLKCYMDAETSPNFHQHGGEWIMAKLSFLDELFLYI